MLFAMVSRSVKIAAVIFQSGVVNLKQTFTRVCLCNSLQVGNICFGLLYLYKI